MRLRGARLRWRLILLRLLVLFCSAAKIAAAYSSSEEDENRVVKSKKDSRFDEFRTIVARMRNHQKIDDWASVAKDFEEIQKVRLPPLS